MIEKFIVCWLGFSGIVDRLCGGVGVLCVGVVLDVLEIEIILFSCSFDSCVYWFVWFLVFWKVCVWVFFISCELLLIE